MWRSQAAAKIDVTRNMTAKSYAHSQTEVDALQGLLGVSNTAEKINVTLAISDARPTSIAKISNSSVDVGGNLNIESRLEREHNVASKANAYDDGTLGTAVAVAIGESTVDAYIEGNTLTPVVAGGDITIAAMIETAGNATAAKSQVGTTLFSKASVSCRLSPA